MFKKTAQLAMTLMLAMTLVLTGCASTNKDASTSEESKTIEAKDMTVGFIYVGPVGDGGYNYAHDQGRIQVEEELAVNTIFKESVPEGPEVEKVAKDMIDQGAKVIFATSFGYMDYIEKLSKEFPEVKFFHCSGYKTTENMSNYFGRIEQSRYLNGIVAGLKTKTNNIGYVGAFPIPEVIRGINAFTLGAQSVNPDVKVTVTWTNTWFDPAKEKAAAVALLDQGADVIAQHQDTAGPQQAAEEKGAFAIGYNTDMYKLAPKSNMTSAVWNWGPYYVEAVKSVMEGNFKSEAYWGGMADGVVDVAPLTENAPAEAAAKVEEVKAKILDGSLNVFQGPIKDQSGAEKIAAGEAVSDADQLSMDWFVQGVVGEIPKQ